MNITDTLTKDIHELILIIMNTFDGEEDSSLLPYHSINLNGTVAS